MKIKKIMIGLMILGVSSMGMIPASPAAAAEASITPAILEKTVDPVVQQVMEAGHIPGTAVVVTLGDKIIYSKGYGFADVEQQSPVDPARTVMRIGSLTKTMTAVAVMQLVEQGLLKLDQDVNTYLDSFEVPSYSNQPITLHHLLTHTAGLDDPIYKIVSHSEKAAWPAGSFLAQYFDQQPPVREPGKEFAYNNAGPGLAGYLIEQVSGSSLEEYMSEQIFKPLDMAHTSLLLDTDGPNLAQSYEYKDGAPRRIPFTYIHLPGAGALGAIPNEWAHLMITLLNDGTFEGRHILNSESVSQMQARQFSEHPDVEGVGYGLYRDRLANNGMLAFWHTGDIDGFTSRMTLIPEQKLGIFVISNANAPGTPLPEQVTTAIVDLLPVTQSPAAPIAVSPTDLEQYARDYTLALGPQHGWGKWYKFLGGRDFEVRTAGDKLSVRGVFPDGVGTEQTKSYVPLNNGLFKDEKLEEYIWFHQDNGTWKMAFTHGITIEEKAPFLQQPSTQIAVYAGVGILWFCLFIIGIFIYVLPLIIRKRRRMSGPTFLIAAIYSVFLAGQLLYGNSEAFMLGYPVWYAWGFSSLPFLASAIAIGLCIHTFRCSRMNGEKKKLTVMGRYLGIALSLGYTFFLLYWNMLSLHYS
ncbi:beta-lactamase family protein [Paenibacillus albidus]|uniref:serine hydrolase domain-containing protein n=1 Tax=Paenibacillus albidus TaxID=2041023 RepID=UPI001BEC5F94|nr:serine hydrolase domain-containing protein [Paenibacillus albidus]MBT2292295.1 beta-lactamase family protein [Paenibacillus albidus]